MAEGLSNAEISDLYARYGHLVRRRCLIVTRDDALADDALQNTFVKVMRYGAAIRQADSPLRWIYRAADRCCFDLLAKRKRRAEVGGEGLEAQLGGAHPEPRFEARDAVMSLLGRLNDRDRRIAVLYFVDGSSQAEIGAEVGVSRVTVNKRLQHIRAKAEKLRAARR